MDKKIEERTTAETFVMYVNLLWHWAWLLILCALLAGGVTYWFSSNQTPVYQASTTVMIDAAPSQTAQGLDWSQLSASQQLATTYAQVMVMNPVLDGVAKQLNLATFPPTASVQATPVTDTQLINVMVQDTDPQRAALLANTLVQVFSDQVQADHAARFADTKKSLEEQKAGLEEKIQTTASALAALGVEDANSSKKTELQTALEEYRQSYASVLYSLQEMALLQAQSSSGVIQKDPAVPLNSPISPRPVRDTILAAITGLLIAAGGVFLIEFLDDTIRDPEEITRKWGVPVLGMIISYPHNKDSLITAKEPRSPITEAYRSLRTNLQFASVDRPVHTLLVTSPSPGDGKTTVAANLGSVIAQGGRKAILVDADLRRPRMHKLLQVPNRDGLADLFIRSTDRLNGSVKPTELTGLNVLTAGHLPPNPSELLGSEKMSEVLRQLVTHFDTVVIDAPPLLLVTDALVLAPGVDGVLVVVKPSITKRTALKHLLEQLHQVNAKVLGVIINDVKPGRSRYYNYPGYYYNRKYGKGDGYLAGGTGSSKKSEYNGVGKPRSHTLMRGALSRGNDTQEKKPTGINRP